MAIVWFYLFCLNISKNLGVIMVRKIYEESDAKEVNRRKERIQRVRDEKKLKIRRGIELREELKELAKLEADYYES